MKILILTIFLLSCRLLIAQETVQMIKKDGVLYVPCKVNGLDMNFIFDTGASDVTISISEALFMIKNGYIDESEILGATLHRIANGDIAEGTQIILRRIEIGEVVLNNVPASIIHTIDAPLLLGQSALEKFGSFSIDYSKDILIIGISDNYKSIENPQDIYDYFIRASQKYKQGDFYGALHDFNKVIELDPYLSNAYYNRSLTKIQLEDFEGAIKDCNTVIDLDKNNSLAYSNRCYIKNSLGDYEGAIQDCNIAIEIDPYNMIAFSSRGYAKVQSEDLKSALQDFNKAIEINSEIPEYYNSRGIIKSELDDNFGAIQDFDKAIEINPNYGIAFYYRAIAKYILDDINGGCDDFYKAFELGYKEAYKKIQEYCE